MVISSAATANVARIPVATASGRAAAVVATAALGLSLVVGGMLTQGRQAGQEAAAPASTSAFASSSHLATMWDFREDRRAETRDLFMVDQFTYREDRRVDSAAPAWAPDFWTYREERP